MVENEVIRLLGQPLSVRPSVECVIWDYVGPTRNPRDPNGPANTPETTRFTADITGIIKEVSGTYLKGDPKHLLGQPLDMARARYGAPSEVIKVMARRYLTYATGTGDRSHYNRSIGIDATGRVCDIITDWYQD